MLANSRRSDFSISYALGVVIACTSIMSLSMGLPAYSDEFDAFAVYSEAKPFNDQWQACAASYTSQRLRSQLSSDVLAGNAIRSCRDREISLSRFLVERIGKKSAENVVGVLRERYHRDLSAAIDNLRMPDH
ncbi:hypothetical protein HPT29_025750 (plasmid) [Microvirga terrae]|uniref:Uncharacterized protein n=1 Tax=Microvirga terrae TaxID=2740529 RepID=A0ABY5RZ74_9HYPH|nr:hypothetical protein [Microvirga terrae]UVF22550.1 hypothetical protein HPT29_025750 [Microvirga terrae]